MEFLSYNIMSGGFSDYGDTANVPQRIDLLKEILAEQKTDFVSLIDTYRWIEVFTRADLQEMFGYKNVFMVKLDDERLIEKGHDNGITVMTNLEVANFSQVRLFNRNAIKTELKVGGNLVDIFSVYLDDVSEDTRLKQMKSLLDLMSDKPTVFMGDLNTMDMDDKTKIPILGNILDMVFKEMSRGEVISLIKQNGFSDTNSLRFKTVPTKLFPIKTDGALARLDYIFYRGNFECRNFEVITGELFEKISDHFPVKANLEL
ncbi:MAG: endonuclease/exonuclease/phosphatase family protein [Candidatus Shapirobacteria bacterium]|nr:endonuclease/exonuclease/phosphatase family protein [Candidatus Shapirobacteria bacterium]